MQILWLVIFAKQAKIQVSEILTVIIFAIDKFGTCALS